MATDDDHRYVSNLHRYAFDVAFDLAEAIAAAKFPIPEEYRR